MAKEDKKSVVPKLRFPEFRGSAEWNAERMDSLYSFMRNNTLARDKLNYEAGTAKNIHYGDIHTKFSTLFDVTKERVPYINVTEALPDTESDDYCVEGDLVFADSSEDTNDVGKCIEIVRLENQLLLAGQHTILARRKNGKLVIGFGGHVFQSARVRSQIQHEAQGTKVYAISPTRLARITIAYPGDEDEQKKIVDCLSSLDELIAVQGRKVEVLKTYKRGLMQQLFPREGETLPRLRFPEFCDAPEWSETPLGDLVDLLSGNPFDGIDIVEDRTGVPLMRGINVTEGSIRHSLAIDRYYLGPLDGLEKYRLKQNDLVIAMDGSKVGKNYALISETDADSLLIQRVARLRATSVPAIKFIFQQIHSTRFHAYVDRINTSSGIPHISAKQIKEYPIHSTGEEEQQRIAEFLSVLDTQITAEADKFAALKAQKKGLMQQLFPSSEKA